MRALKLFWNHFSNSKTKLSGFLWSLLTFVVTAYKKISIDGEVKFMTWVIDTALQSWLPIIIGLVLIAFFHLFRLDLYLKIDKLENDNSTKNEYKNKWGYKVGFLYSMVDRWVEDGVSSVMLTKNLTKEIDAYTDLKNLSMSFMIDDDKKNDIKLFLKYFNISSRRVQGIPVQVTIKTVFKSKEGANKEIEIIRKLAKKITYGLS